MSIEDKVELLLATSESTIKREISTVPKCFHGGVYHYRSSQDGKQYCVLSDDTCLYYKLGRKNEDLCVSYNTSKK